MRESPQSVRTDVALHHGAASTAVADLLTGPRRPAEVLSTTRAAQYLDCDGTVVALVAMDAVHLPNAVVVPHLPTGIAAGARAAVGHGLVEVGGHAVAVARWWDPKPRLASEALDVIAMNADALDEAIADDAVVRELRKRAAPLPAALHAGAGATVEGLLGFGPGSTPSGDDLLAGFLATVYLLAEARGWPGTTLRSGFDTLAAAACIAAPHRTTRLSATLLQHAVRGEVAVPASAVLHALHGTRTLRGALPGLLAVGHTSGRDLALGIALGAKAAIHHLCLEGSR